jgi:hypothetical protein
LAIQTITSLILGRVTNVGRGNHVLQFPERMTERQRLAREDFEGGASDRVRSERGDKCVLVDDRAAGRVYQPGRRLDERQFLRAHEPASRRAEHKMDRQHLRLTEELVFRDECRSGRSRRIKRQVAASML